MQISSELDEKLRLLLRVFLAENANINLSALRTEEACWVGNILDSLGLMEIPEQKKLKPESTSFIDIGTGGGFPLLPLALAYPESHFTGLDSIKKKIDALGRIATAAHIPNVTLVADRAEVLGQSKKYREQYDIVTSRAVAPLNTLLEYCSAFAKVGGAIVLWKSVHIDDELKASEKAQQRLRCPLEKTFTYTLPLDFGSRQLLIFRKNGPLDKKYPREVGMAKKEPL